MFVVPPESVALSLRSLPFAPRTTLPPASVVTVGDRGLTTTFSSVPLHPFWVARLFWSPP